MPEDATLDAFAGAADPADDDTADAANGDAEADGRVDTDAEAAADVEADDAGATAVDPDDVAPAAVTSTYREGGTCPSCGEPAARLWRAEDASVCAGCASWTPTGRDACDQ